MSLIIYSPLQINNIKLSKPKINNLTVKRKLKSVAKDIINQLKNSHIDKRPCISLEVQNGNGIVKHAKRYEVSAQDSQDQLLVKGGSGAKVTKKNSYKLITKNQLSKLRKINKILSILKKEKQSKSLDITIKLLKKKKKVILTANYVRKKFQLTEQTFLEASLHQQTTKQSQNSIIQHRLRHEINVFKYGIIINLNNILNRTSKKDNEIKTHLSEFYNNQNVNNLMEKILNTYKELKNEDIELFYDMDWYKTETVGNQIFTSENPILLLINLAQKIKEIISIRIESSLLIEVEKREQKYDDYFGNKFKQRLSDINLNSLINLSNVFSTIQKKEKYEGICNNLYKDLSLIKNEIFKTIKENKGFLFPNYESIEIHSDMNLGNLLGNLNQNQLVYIDNCASLTKKRPVTTEFSKLLFGFSHQGNLENFYQLNEKNQLDLESEKKLHEMLKYKQAFFKEVSKNKIEIEEKSPYFFKQSYFFSLVQHISDAGYVIEKQIPCIVDQIKKISVTTNIKEKELLEQKLESLIKRCCVNVILYKTQMKTIS